MPTVADPTAAVSLTATDLGFATQGDGSQGAEAWRTRLGVRTIAFRPLRRLPELLAVEALQWEVFGVTERDLLAASALVTVPETGGEVIAAFLDGAEDPIGVVVGWGGYRAGRPILVSELLAVRADARGLGLGAALKRLQAAVALERGFPTMTWTVDPLRAANARLNFEKLGALADRYEEDRYGADFGAGLYGGLLTDRLHVTWPLTTPRTRARLLGQTRPTSAADVADLPRYAPGLDAPRALVPLPSDVDRLLLADPAAVRRWRLALRADLQRAVAAGYSIIGFVADRARGEAVYVIDREPEP